MICEVVITVAILLEVEARNVLCVPVDLGMVVSGDLVPVAVPRQGTILVECVRDEIKAWVLSRHDRVALCGVSVKLLGCYVRARVCECMCVGVGVLWVSVRDMARGRPVGTIYNICHYNEMGLESWWPILVQIIKEDMTKPFEMTVRSIARAQHVEISHVLSIRGEQCVSLFQIACQHCKNMSIVRFFMDHVRDWKGLIHIDCPFRSNIIEEHVCGELLKCDERCTERKSYL